ncbi:MAG: aminoglycoside phosphotransferase family protein [Defluviitaleaceae bacterium]|nr:aminoglycoside phosphotransferase family protein [Defluviitaleaceae bacterium]
MGAETDGFLSRVDGLIEKYSQKWQLTDLNYMLTDTVNLLFSCKSTLHGLCVLKMCIPGPEVATEINCIQAYNGQGYVKLWDYDLSDDILLLERIEPGNQMWDVQDYKERARLMAELIKTLPFIKCPQGEYPNYKIWMEGIHKYLTNIGGMEDVLFYLNEALRLYSELKQQYTRSCLLHGDMHQENLLLNQQGSYTIIDPKGVVDDPIMETARFLNNELPCSKKKIQEMVAIMAPTIKVPKDDMHKSMYIDMALGCCWTLEEKFISQESFEKAKSEVLADCRFVYEFILRH